MATRGRPADIGRERGRELVRVAGRTIREARQDRNLRLRDLGAVIGRSEAHISRIERGLVPDVSVVELAQLHALVGLELSQKAYPGGPPIRDAAQQALIAAFCSVLHPSLGWATEVPVPLPRDQRAWDLVIRGDAWRAGVEAETGPADGQATTRRILLKQRDSGLEVAILLLPSTDRARRFLQEAGQLLRSSFPVPGPVALAALQDGRAPDGNAVIVLPVPRRRRGAAE
jgi:transcriptional regulator with XRE-family HTH domain